MSDFRSSCALLIVALSATWTATAFAKEIRVHVTAMGQGTDSDRGSASTAAKDNAEGGLVCVGHLEDVRTNVTGCSKIGDNYMCMAVANGTCVIGH